MVVMSMNADKNFIAWWGVDTTTPNMFSEGLPNKML